VIGLIDSGTAPDTRVIAACAFILGDRGSVERRRAGPDLIGHGSSIAATILASTAGSKLVAAQVFARAMTTAPAVVAAALDWLISERVGLVNMSFGLARDRGVLRDACAAARAAGVILVAASPARGAKVFPAAYPEVIRVCGDARCAAGEISLLEDDGPLFGACPATLDDRVRGASAAAAHVSATIAAWLNDRPEASFEAAVQHLRSISRHRGRERHRIAAFD
jgi:Subtilase family